MLGERYVVENVEEFYNVVGKSLLEKGEIIHPRGLETRELIAPQIIIKDPLSRLVYNSERKFNIFHALSEAIMLYSISKKVRHIGEFNRNMKKFSDNGEDLYGSYGARISFLIDQIVTTLRKDKDTRQAVLSIFNNKDHFVNTKDVPCTENLHFLIRDNKLNLIVNMRSNDILYGFQYDVFMFTMLQEAVANSLSLKVGYYIHQPASLHVYKDTFSFEGYGMLEQMINKSSEVRFSNESNHNEWRSLARLYTVTNDLRIGGNDFLIETEAIAEIKGFAAKIFDMIEVERARRAKVITDLKPYYNQMPQWAKLFLNNWVKDESN